MTARRSIWILALAAALTALLAGACSKAIGPDTENEDDGWTNVGGDLPISFSSSLDIPATKGTLPAYSTFGVFAYYTKTSNWGNGNNFTPNFMYNEDVAFDGTSYTYDPIKYWPNSTNDKITFWAYYPYSANAVLYKANNSSTVYTNATKNFPDIRFTVTDGQTDFMISNVASNKTRPAVNTPVLLTFNHALSSISFYVKKVDTAVPEKYTVKLKSIRLDGISDRSQLKGIIIRYQMILVYEDQRPVLIKARIDKASGLILDQHIGGCFLPRISVVKILRGPPGVLGDLIKLLIFYNRSLILYALSALILRDYIRFCNGRGYVKDIP